QPLLHMLVGCLENSVFLASCLSSDSHKVNRGLEEKGAGVFFFSLESAALQSALSGFRSTRRCQGSSPGFYTHQRSHYMTRSSLWRECLV
ncbi:hypothetical protein XENOCAPTIV_000354, partial [Xenoophorus captivus]